MRTITDEHGGSSKNYPFQIPPLKVGTIDSLMSLSDDLAKQDLFVEQTTKKIERSYVDLYKSEAQSEAKDEKVEVQVPELKVGDLNAVQFAQNFKWDPVRYPFKRATMKAMTDMIVKDSVKAENDLKNNVQAYNELRAAISAIEKRENGNLLVKSLSPYVKQDQVLETEHMASVFIVLRKNRVDDFLATYESCDDSIDEKDKKRLLGIPFDDGKEAAAVEALRKADMMVTSSVVPRSALKLTEDDEYALFRVVILRRNLNLFKFACRERRWVVRDYSPEDKSASALKEELKTMKAQKQQKWNFLMTWCQTNYGSILSGWLHLKAIRTYIESILRYGLPANFTAILVQPKKGAEKKLRNALHAEFSKSTSLFGGKQDKDATVEADIAGLGGVGDFYPYVYLTLDLDA